MDDLIADFVAECREMLEALGGEIVAWEAEPDDRARLDSIFRFVHTVKGNCGFFEFPRLEALSHAAEDALADVRAGRRIADGPLVTAVLAIIDRIGEMVAAIEAGEEMPAGDDSALIQALAPGAEGPVAPVAATVAEAQGKIAAPRTIRLSVELLDRVMSGVSDMVLARNELARRLRESSSDVSVDGAFERLSSIIAEMRDAITRTRMQRIENLFIGPAADGPRPVDRARQAGAGRYRRRRRRARPRDDRDDPRSADPHHSQRGRSRDRRARPSGSRRASARSASWPCPRGSPATRS